MMQFFRFATIRDDATATFIIYKNRMSSLKNISLLHSKLLHHALQAIAFPY
jgi:hypothetical protein